MANSAKRVHVIQELIDPETGEGLGYDRDQAAALLGDLEAVLFRHGGMVNIAARRVQVGEVMGEPLALSTELVVTWDSFSPLERLPDDAPAPEPDADHPLVAEDEPLEPGWIQEVGGDDDTRTAEEIAAEMGEEPISEPTGA